MKPSLAISPTTAEESPAAAPAQPSLRSRALRGSAWILAGYGAGQVIRLGSNIVLTRLLFPELFGIMALVNVFMTGLQMFSDIGIGAAIIQSERGDDPRFVNTAWTMQVLRGAALWLACPLIAWPLSVAYGQPQLLWLIPVAGVSALIAGFNSTALFSLNRHLQLGKLTLVELVSQVAGIGLTIGLALWMRNIWSLVLGALGWSLVRMVLSHFLVDGPRNRFTWDAQSIRDLLSFGRWIFVCSLLTFLAGQTDRLVFGKVMSIGLLGVYGIAAMLAALPTEAVLKLGSSVAFAAYSGSHRSGGGALARAFGQLRLPLIAAGGVIVSCLVVVGPQLVGFLYDQRYHEAGWMLQLLGVAAWLQILESTNGSALLACGAVRAVAAGHVAKLAALCVLMPMGYWLGQIPGAILGAALAEGARYGVSAISVHRRGLRGWRMDAGMTAMVVTSVAASFVLLGWVQRSAQVNRLLLLCIAAGTVCLLWAPVLYRTHPFERRRRALDA